MIAHAFNPSISGVEADNKNNKIPAIVEGEKKAFYFEHGIPDHMTTEPALQKITERILWNEERS